MTEENLDAAIDNSLRTHKQELIVKNLAERTHLTLEQVTKLTAHPDHGEIIKGITLQDIVEKVTGPGPEKATKKGAKKTLKKAAKKKATKKAPKKASTKTVKKGAKKKATKKKATKKEASKEPAAKGPKADKGKPKPRLDYETGMKETLGALRAAEKPLGRMALETATGYTGVQVRTFCKKLAEAGRIKILGEGGRSTLYQAV